jgi:archaemetzincin
VIYVAPIGIAEESVLFEAADCIREHFIANVQVGAAVPEPPAAYDSRRGQFGSLEYLRALAQAAPVRASKFLGITERDLFIPMLTFVFGQAQLDGKVALVSIARLRQEFYGLPPDPSVLRERLRKEVTHELGHAFGLIHCSQPGCTMTLSTGIHQVDLKHESFCRGCRQTLNERSLHLKEVHP